MKSEKRETYFQPRIQSAASLPSPAAMQEFSVFLRSFPNGSYRLYMLINGSWKLLKTIEE